MTRTGAVTGSEEADFYAKGRDWEADRLLRYEKSERRAWLAAGGFGVVAVAAVIGMASMAPLKRVVPYVFALDRASGNVEIVSAADDRTPTGYQELLDKHWAQKYVIARESYSWKLLQSDYDTVLALSSDPVGREFAKVYEGSNARDKRFGAGIEMRVRVLSVTLANDDAGSKAVIRFEKTTKRTEADSADAPQYFVSTIAFEYKPSMTGREKDLIQNPLGYRVLSYRVDAEVAAATAAKAPGAAP
jgi:type IV secretion system protein VirB8